MKTITMTIKDDNPLTIDVYYYFEGIFALQEFLEAQTEIEWTFAGSFMDVAAFYPKNPNDKGKSIGNEF